MEINSKVHPQQLMKVTAAASCLRVSRLKIYEMIRNNELDYITVSGSPIIVINSKFNNLKGVK